MIIEILMRINDELDDEYHDQRLEIINYHMNTLKKIHKQDQYFLDEVNKLIDKIELKDQIKPYIIIPLIIPNDDYFTIVQPCFNLKEEKFDEISLKLWDVLRKYIVEIETIKLGITDDIDEIRSLTDDDKYEESITDLFLKTRFDTDGYPESIHIDYDVLKLLQREGTNWDYDYEIITKAEEGAIKLREEYRIWEKYFVDLDQLIKKVTRGLKGTNASSMDYTKTELQTECDIQIINSTKRQGFKEAILKLFKKHPNFRKDGKGYKIVNPDNNKPESKDKPDYHVRANIPFFESDESYFNKNDTRIKKFLTESKKVTLSSDMEIICFKHKNAFYYLTIDNSTKSLVLNDVNTAFQYINRQSNLFYQIRAAITKELREDIDEFESYLLKEIRSNTGFNSKLLIKIYRNDISKFFKSKYINSDLIDDD